MKTIIATIVITLLCVSVLFQEHQISELRAQNAQLVGALDDFKTATQRNISEACNELHGEIVTEIKTAADQTEAHVDKKTTDKISDLQVDSASKLALKNLKSEHDQLQTQVDQLKADMANNDHDLRQLVIRAQK